MVGQTAIEYAIHNQRDRRNLADGELLNCVAALDKRKAIGRPQKTSSDEEISGPTAEQTGETLGISRAKVERARTILDHADGETKEAVESGEISINKAYEQTQEKQ